jgi:exopolysaccharide biosynthesis polyprenyl glycosylphosphotransferase
LAQLNGGQSTAVGSILDPATTEAQRRRLRLAPTVAPVPEYRGGWKPRLNIETAFVLATDILSAALLALVIQTWIVFLTGGIAATVWAARGLYRRRIAMAVLDDLPVIATGVLIALGPTTAIALAVEPSTLGKVLLSAAGVLVAATVGRALAYSLILRRRVNGRSARPTVMVGAGTAAESLARRVRAHPESGLRLVGRLTTRDNRQRGSIPLLGTTRELPDIARQRQVTDVVIGYGGMSAAELVDVVRDCERANLEIYVVPRLFELHSPRDVDDHIWGLPLVRLRSPAQRLLTWRLKRAFDVVVATCGLLIASPVLLGVALAVRIELGRGILFRQTRIGQLGRPFDMMKFRSLPVGNGASWAVPEEQLGPVGRCIRRYSLDELPQLFNVLRGDMSLVGPRPERPEYVHEFTAAIPRYLHRHRLPAGLTGLAAVNGLRGDTSIEDRVQFDNWYIDNWSFWLDMKILLRTLQAVLRGAGR